MRIVIGMIISTMAHVAMYLGCIMAQDNVVPYWYVMLAVFCNVIADSL